MVQTYQSPVWVYKHPFELVMAAYEKRFPTCDLLPVLISSEIVSESESPDGSVMIRERLCKLRIDAPYIVKKIAGVDHMSFVQKNKLDRRNRTLTIEVRNLSFAHRISVKELCRYYVHPENDAWTSYEQNAHLDVLSFFGLESVVEKIAIKHYTQNIQNGKKILETHIEEVKAEGVDYIPPFVSEQLRNGLTPQDASSNVLNNRAQQGGFISRQRKGSAIFESRNWKHASAKRSRATSLGGSASLGDNKLESEYIQRFLGHLTALEESRLIELRNSLANAHTGKTPNDAHLLRFLRACDFDVDRARDMVLKSIMWRKQHGVDRILSAYRAPSVFGSHVPGCWHGHDLEGHPLYVLRFGMLDLKGLFKTVGEEGVVKYVLSVCEQGLIRAEEATRQSGKPISAWTLLVDLEGLSIRHLWRPALRTLLKIIEIVQDNYPETMASLLIIRPPRVFTALWTLVSPFISERTSKKIHMLSGSGYEQTLRQYVEEKHIPDFCGGLCAIKLPSGQIPRSLHNPEFSAALGHGLEQMYTTAHLCKNYYHELLTPVGEKGAVLAWDFDVVKGVCVFSVLYSPDVLSDDADDPFAHRSSTCDAASAMKSITGLVGTVGATSDLSMATDAKHNKMVEESRTLCKEGDSVQGSQVCDKTGTYILQWVCTEALSANQLQFECPPLPMINSSKCKVVYYCELLGPKFMEESMTEECRSSIMSLRLSDRS